MARKQRRMSAESAGAADTPTPAAASAPATPKQKGKKQAGKAAAQPVEAVDEMKQLKEHASFFDTMLRMIPSDMYVGKTEAEAEMDWRQRRFVKNAKGAAPKSDIKSLSKKERKAIKKAKLDPNAAPTVEELRQKRKREEADEEASDDDEEAADGAMEGAASIPDLVFDTKQASLEELRGRLDQRMEKFRANRKAEEMTRKDVMERRTKTKNKPKKTGNSSVAPDRAPAFAAAAPESAPQSYEAGEQVTFNKFDLANGGQFDGSAVKKRKALSSDPRQALEQLEAKKRRLETIKLKDADKATRIEEKMDWESVLARARGEKVKDDTKMLKKAVKRKEQEKKKSTTQWGDRQRDLKEQQARAVKKREENIAARQASKKTGARGKSTSPKTKSGKSGPKDKGPGFKGKGSKGSKGGKPSGKPRK